jgi:hypothetical protein
MGVLDRTEKAINDLIAKEAAAMKKHREKANALDARADDLVARAVLHGGDLGQDLMDRADSFRERARNERAEADEEEGKIKGKRETLDKIRALWARKKSIPTPD